MVWDMYTLQPESSLRDGPIKIKEQRSKMRIIRTVKDMQEVADERRRDGLRLALVPTMGALHEGHLALVEAANAQSDHVTVSIFVNPTQFGPGEDFQAYPRSLDDDLVILDKSGGVDVVFAPTVREMYPQGATSQQIHVDVKDLDAHLCGRHRPGHFTGVVTVVTMLFHCCKPHVSVFGLKDAQQFLILKRMVRDLHFDIDLVGIETVREQDGLAFSSRNVYLSDAERAQAVVLNRALKAAKRAIIAGEQQSEGIVETMLRVLAEAPDARVQYAEVVDQADLQPLEYIVPGLEVLAAVAVYFGNTRLIDNVLVKAPV